MRQSKKLTQGFMVLTTGLALFCGAYQVEAKGCIKGAAVGAVAGHVAGHHAVLGAAVGCAAGHHLEKQKERVNTPPKGPSSQKPRA